MVYQPCIHKMLFQEHKTCMSSTVFLILLCPYHFNVSAITKMTNLYKLEPGEVLVGQVSGYFTNVGQMDCLFR